MVMKATVGIQASKLKRWRYFAEKATPVYQMCSVPVNGGWRSMLTEQDGTRIARDLKPEDGRFHAEARVAVLALVDEVEALQAYTRYVAEVIDMAGKLLTAGVHQALLPLTFEDWWQSQAEGQN